MVRDILKKMKPSELRKYITMHNKVIRANISKEIKEARVAYSQTLKVKRRELKSAREVNAKGKKKDELIELIMNEPLIVKQVKKDQEEQPAIPPTSESGPVPDTSKKDKEDRIKKLEKAMKKSTIQAKVKALGQKQVIKKRTLAGKIEKTAKKLKAEAKVAKELKKSDETRDKKTKGDAQKKYLSLMIRLENLPNKIKQARFDLEEQYSNESIDEELEDGDVSPIELFKRGIKNVEQLMKRPILLFKDQGLLEKDLAKTVKNYQDDPRYNESVEEIEFEKDDFNKSLTKIKVVLMKKLNSQQKKGKGKAPLKPKEEPKAKPKAKTAAKPKPPPPPKEDTESDDEVDPPISKVPKKLHKVWIEYMEEKVGDYYSKGNQQEELDELKEGQKEYFEAKKRLREGNLNAKDTSRQRKIMLSYTDAMKNEFDDNKDFRKIYSEFASRLLREYDDVIKEEKKRQAEDKKAAEAVSKDSLKFQEELAKKKQKENEAEEKRIAKFEESERKRKEGAKKTASKEIKPKPAAKSAPKSAKLSKADFEDAVKRLLPQEKPKFKKIKNIVGSKITKSKGSIFLEVKYEMDLLGEKQILSKKFKILLKDFDSSN
tara:strand:- start:4095 stop:5897 length:1803 start_codon:yes stop_codon:yes gene_type:complete